MSLANPHWGAPQIHGELLKLGIDVSQATVAKHMVRQRKPRSQTWRTFLNNHVKDWVSTDFFVVPTISFRVLYVFTVLTHHRRRVIHFNLASNPTSEWTAQQIAKAFPWDTAPRYLLHDRDSIYGIPFRRKVRGMGIREVLTATRAPWQNPHVERLVGSVRRECLDHVIVFTESSLRRILKWSWSITNTREPICRWRKMHPNHEPFSRRRWIRWWRSLKLEAFTTGTSGEQPETIPSYPRRSSFDRIGEAGSLRPGTDGHRSVVSRADNQK